MIVARFMMLFLIRPRFATKESVPMTVILYKKIDIQGAFFAILVNLFTFLSGNGNGTKCYSEKSINCTRDR